MGRLPLLASLLLLFPATGGCRRFTPAEADRDVARILEARRPCVPELAGSLHLDAAERIAEAARHGAAYRLGLREALALAYASGREHRAQREEVYLAALALTGARNRFRPLWGGGAAGALDVGPDATDVSASGDLALARAFESGGSLVLGLALDVARGLATGDPLRLAQSVLRADLLLPLARGSGVAAREGLTQAERETLYAMRDFARFQQSFTVQVATAFYRVLQDRDTWRNEERTYENLGVLLERQEAMGAQQAGRIPGLQVDQARQDRLRADERRLRARTAYEAALDRFKLLLGVPLATAIDLQDADLERLRAEGPRAPPLEGEEAAHLALLRRLDLLNARGREEDARRHVLVARDGVRPQVDLRMGTDLVGPRRRPLDVEDVDPFGSIGLDLDLPLERTAERNAWRAATLRAVRARREREAAEDRVVLSVRDAFRSLDQARRSHEIQVAGVALAEERVDSTDDLLLAGRAIIRDRLEAEEALVQARNALTRAIVDHAIALLEWERDVGVLLVDLDGRWPLPAGPEGAAGEDGSGDDAAAGDAGPVPDASGAADRST